MDISKNNELLIVISKKGKIHIFDIKGIRKRESYIDKLSYFNLPWYSSNTINYESMQETVPENINIKKFKIEFENLEVSNISVKVNMLNVNKDYFRSFSEFDLPETNMNFLCGFIMEDRLEKIVIISSKGRYYKFLLDDNSNIIDDEMYSRNVIQFIKS